MEFREEITTGNVSLGLLDIESAFETKELDEPGNCDREKIGIIWRNYLKCSTEKQKEHIIELLGDMKERV